VTISVTPSNGPPFRSHYVTALAFRRSAQYFFIRTLTAFFAAGDILERLRRRRCFFDGLGSAFQGNGLSPLQAPRLGLCRRIPAISDWSC
jgi:hypothetical protein